MQLLLRGEAQAVHRVGPAVGPLAELLGRLGERHAGCDAAVDDGLPGSEPQTGGQNRRAVRTGGQLGLEKS